MTKSDIILNLDLNHKKFTNYIDGLSNEDFNFSLNNEKWNAAHQLDHIYRSMKPLGDGIILPKFMIGLVFGKSNRPSKTYEELVAKYHEKLAGGGKARGNFIPKGIDFSQKAALKAKTEKVVAKLCKHLNKYSEEELDKHILPHPILGKLTMREMMYFTIYHVEHHHKITKQNLAAKN